MSPEEAAGARADTMRCLRDILNTTDDPEKRMAALFVAYIRFAGICAAVFFTELQIDPGSIPHLGQSDLSDHAHVVAGDLITKCQGWNHERGIEGSEMDLLTAKIVGEAFFDKLNELIGAQPARGTA